MTETTNLIFAGVGGQGVLLIAELTALAAVRAGYDVKQTEVHGVSQRGGSVESHVRFGLEVHSPLVQRGQADVVVGLEKLEGLRYASYLRMAAARSRGPLRVADSRWPIAAEGQPSPTSRRPSAEGILLVNDYEIIPGSVANAAEHYPHHALDFLRDKGVAVLALPASERANDLGDGRMANMILLGALAALLDLPDGVWPETLRARLPARRVDANWRAFQVGWELAAVPVS